MDRGMAGGLQEYLQRQYSDGSAPLSPAHPLSMMAGSFASRNKRAPGPAAANARLAQMMMKKKPDYDAYDDDEPFDAPISAIVGGAVGWSSRSGSPRLGSAGGASTVARNPSPMWTELPTSDAAVLGRAAMDRMRTGSPAYSRQGSGSSSASGSSSPGLSPGHHRSASASSISGIRRTQNLAAKAASARLAQVMASQAADNEEDDEDLTLAAVGARGAGRMRFGLPRSAASSNGGAADGTSLLGRLARSPSPSLGRNIVEPAPANRPASNGRTPLSVRTAPMVPQVKTTARTPSPIPAIEPPVDKRGGKRYIPEMGRMNPRDSGDGREASALQDKLDMLEEDNYNLLEKLQFAEERCTEAEARSRQLENQVANLGEGVSLEARLLSRKEAVLRQREEAMKAAMRAKDEKGEELIVLREQVQSARDEAASIVEQLKDAELEVKALRSMTQRMVLTQEEMEEVLLKRCWLARYWGLASQHGIYPDISAAKHEYWSSLAPLPLEVVTSAGQKAKDESWSNAYGDSDWRNKLGSELSDVTTEGSIENMLAVEKGLRELASLKVEDAVVLAMAEHRRPNLLRQSSSDFKSPGDPKFLEAFELSQEEVEDVRFKQSWLAYFWRRAKRHGVEDDIAEEHMQFWIDCIGKSPTSHDAVDVERGLIELRKVCIEQQLWEASRRDLDDNQKPPADEENSQLV